MHSKFSTKLSPHETITLKHEGKGLASFKVIEVSRAEAKVKFVLISLTGETYTGMLFTGTPVILLRIERSVELFNDDMEISVLYEGDNLFSISAPQDVQIDKGMS